MSHDTSRRSVADRGVRSEIQTYFNEINRVPLLTADEERELGWAIINDGCMHSRERMIRANLRLVVAIAKNFMNRGLPLSDLIEEGNIGLVRAVDGFDPAQGARFSTYASWWIKQSIKRALMNANQPIHIPAYMVELITKWKIAARKLEQRLGSPPTNEQLAAELDLPVKKVRVIRAAMSAHRSMSQEGGAVGANGRAAPGLNELLTDDQGVMPEDRALRDEEVSILRRLMETIDHREADILRLRYGLDGREPLTLKEVADEVGLSRERVRQVADEAIRMLAQRLEDEKPSRFFRRDRIADAQTLLLTPPAVSAG